MSSSLMIMLGVVVILFGILSFVAKKAVKWIIYICLAAFAIFYLTTGGNLNKALDQTLQFGKNGGQYVVNTASDYVKKNVKVTVESSAGGPMAKIQYANYTVENIIGSKEYQIYKEEQLIKTIKLDQVITIDKDTETVKLPDNLIKLIETK